jgi:hypothetical protein
MPSRGVARWGVSLPAVLALLALPAAGVPAGQAGRRITAEEAVREGSAAKGDAPVEVVAQKFPEPLARGQAEGTAWLPYYVELKARRDRPVQVELKISVLNIDQQAATEIFTARRRVEVPPGAPTRAWLYVRHDGGEGRNLKVRPSCRADGIDIPLAEGDIATFGGDPDEYEIPAIVVGEHTRASLSPWGESNPSIGRQTLSNRRLIRFEEKELPDSAAGYQQARLLILRNPDLKTLEPAQAEAIRRWVFQGGWTIFVPSPTGEIFKSPLVSGLLGDIGNAFGGGARIGEPRVRTGFVPQDLHSAEKAERGARFAKAAAVFPGEGKSYTLIDPVRLPAGKDPERVIVSADPGDEEPLSSGARLYYEMAFGSGRVGVMTLDDMALTEESTLGFRAAFWAQIIGGAAAGGIRARGRDESIPAVIRSGLTRELGIWFIALLVIVYLAVIGPGLYFLLRRLGKLPAIVWVEPLVVILYVGIIAFTAYVTKGVLTKLRTVTVIEHSGAETLALRRSYLGVFSAGDDRYRVAAPGCDFLENVGDHGGAEPRIDMDLGPPDGPAIRDFRIAQWGTALFAARAVEDWQDGAKVTVRDLEEEREGIAGAARRLEIQNDTPFAFRRGFVAEGGKVYLCPAIPKGGAVSASLPEVDLGKSSPSGRSSPGKKADEDLQQDPFEGNDLLRAAVRSLLGESSTFIGDIERDDRDFAVDRPSTLDRRADIYVERR